jgi:SAM-dependent methyltransferase
MFSLLRQLGRSEITLKQAFFALTHFFSIRRLMSGDDFYWPNYHHHYAQEIKSIERSNRLLLEPGDFKLEGLNLKLVRSGTVLPSHHVLYETIYQFQKGTVLEIGSGGGDHLSNLRTISPGLQVQGFDLSEQQIFFAMERHPELQDLMAVADISDPLFVTKIKVDLVFSHAVLMHISEKKGRVNSALGNMLKLASSVVVLVENWQQHDFLDMAKNEASKLPEWRDANYYFHESSEFPGVRSLVIARESRLPALVSYDNLLQGAKLRPH